MVAKTTDTTIKKQHQLYVRELISDMSTPVLLYEKLSRESDYAFLLESAEGDTRLARYSFIGIDPLLTVSLLDGKAVIECPSEGTKTERNFDNPLGVLQELMEQYQSSLSEDAASFAPFPFAGGLVGYMGYGAVRYFEGIQMQSADPHGVPEGAYGLYDSLIVFDHQYRRIKILSRRSMGHADDLANRIIQTESHLPAICLSVLANDPQFASDNDVYDDSVTTSVSKERFLAQVGECQKLIEAGEVFQIVLAQRFSVPVKSSSLDIYRVLQAVNPSPYAYILKYPTFHYIGSSPETFVRCTDGEVMLRAIAGTRPRGKTVLADNELAAELKANEKENAEHLMLVDLGRNDLGRISQVGSIKVGEIATLTRYAHVMHLATEITGTLAAGKTAFDAFRSCFPRGTVSGAPKIRAMQHLAKIEPERRGIYSGVVGYFGFDGNMDGAIAIRSALIKDGVAHVNAGAGIVLDSDPRGEYAETRNKARSLIKAIKLAEAINNGNRHEQNGNKGA